MITIKRAYESASERDGYRVLVDRLWPRGLRKSDLRINEWWKELAPSKELRIWFGHNVSRWQEFTVEYTKEIVSNHAVLEARVGQIKTFPVTLIYAAKDTMHNNAIVLQTYLRTEIFKLEIDTNE